MKMTLINQLGEWNPQFFREIKGQLKTRNLFVVVAISLAIQFLMLMVFSRQECISNDCVQFNLNIQWMFIFKTFNWILPLLLLVSGVYLLIQDVGTEERKGTLNFIRLSPQSSQSILLGKILGVPALLYLAIALTIPLHLVSGLIAGLPLNWILGIYLLWGVGCGLFYSTALLYTLLNSANCDSKSLSGAGGLVAFLLALPYISIIDLSWDYYRSSSELGNFQWLFLPLGSNAFFAFAWMLITVSVATYWFWQAVNRRFHNQNATLLSKQQSYWLVASFQVWLLGFVMQETVSLSSDLQFFVGSFFLFILNPISLLVVNAALSPCRQALQDWARYRHQNYSTRKGFLNNSLVQDLIWGEKSPPLLATALNLLITTTIWLPWILLLPQEIWSKGEVTMLKILLGLFLTINAVLISAAITQIILLMKSSNRNLFAIGTVGTVIVFPLVGFGFLGIELFKVPFVWLLSPLPIIGLATASATTVFLGLLTQFAVLGVLILQVTRQIRKAGESASKVLLNKGSLLPSNGLK